MTTAVHPAPSPALHTLNAPELLHHNAAHPDSLATSAVEVVGPACAYDPALSFGSLTQAVQEAAHPAPAAPQAHTGLVYETTNYDLFHLLPENRAVDARHVRKLVALIGQSNLLHLKPLDVTADFGVIDGQHRLAAARELGLPIFYKVDQGLDEAAITTLNLGQRNWQGADYLHYWAVKGKASYQALATFRKRHPKLSFSNAKLMLSPQKADMRLDAFNAGLWEAQGLEAAERTAELLARIVDEAGFAKAYSTRFVAALHRCVVTVEGFDPDHFMRKLNMQPRALKPQVNERQHLEMFQDIYNYKTAQDNRLRFF